MTKSRRSFLQNTTLAGLGLALTPQVNFALNNDREELRVGLIGVGLRGTNHLENLLLRKDARITAICDIDPARIELNLELVEKAGKPKPTVFVKDEQDYLRLLEIEEVDAVIISTPWEWHARMAIDAMQAGKYTGLEISAAMTTAQPLSIRIKPTLTLTA